MLSQPQSPMDVYTFTFVLFLFFLKMVSVKEFLVIT